VRVVPDSVATLYRSRARRRCCSSGTVYYQPRQVSAAGLAIMRQSDALHLGCQFIDPFPNVHCRHASLNAGSRRFLGLKTFLKPELPGLSEKEGGAKWLPLNAIVIVIPQKQWAAHMLAEVSGKFATELNKSDCAVASG
jgi:hypothetical protein